MLTTFKGLKDFLLGKQTLPKSEHLVQPEGRLPEVTEVIIHKCTNLFKPTVLSNLKMDPYVAVYLTSKKAFRVQTEPKWWGGSNPTFETNLKLPFEGEPLMVIQVFAKEPIRDEFLGEAPLDMIKVLNSRSRTWSGPVTIYGQKGTALRGEVHITLSLFGGDPYNSSCPAVTRAQMETTIQKTPAKVAGKTPAKVAAKTPAKVAGKTPAKVAANFAGNESCSTINSPQSDQYSVTHEMPQAVGTHQSPYGGGRQTPGGKSSDQYCGNLASSAATVLFGLGLAYCLYHRRR